MRSQAHANFDVEWQTLSGSRTSGIFGWDFSYDIGFYNETLLVDLDIALTGAAVEQPLLDRWESGIENIWSTNRFSVPISFNIDWVSGDYDQLVTVHSGSADGTLGQAYNMSNWFLEGSGGWDDEYQEDLAAHEAGHMFGLWDEYAGGAVDPVSGLINTDGLMHTLTHVPTLDYYYDDMLSWYDDNVDQTPPSTSVPESGTLALASIGIIGMLVGRRRRN